MIVYKSEQGEIEKQEERETEREREREIERVTGSREKGEKGTERAGGRVEDG